MVVVTYLPESKAAHYADPIEFRQPSHRSVYLLNGLYCEKGIVISIKLEYTLSPFTTTTAYTFSHHLYQESEISVVSTWKTIWPNLMYFRIYHVKMGPVFIFAEADGYTYITLYSPSVDSGIIMSHLF